MLRRLRTVLLVVGFAVLGAVAGRIAADLRRRNELGEPLELSRGAATPRPQEIVPGLIAALRTRDRPWSFLHIPSWFAAFTVNFVFSALGRELQPFGRGEPIETVPPAAPYEARTIEARPVHGDAPIEAPAAQPTANGGLATEGFTPFRD